MFITFLLLAFAGYITYLLISLDKYNSQTPYLNKIETIKEYFGKYLFVVFAALIILIVFTYLLTLDGGAWLVQLLTNEEFTGETPFSVHLTAYFIGLFNVIIVKWIYDKFVKPTTIEPK